MSERPNALESPADADAFSDDVWVGNAEVGVPVGGTDTGLIGRHQLCFELASGGIAKAYLVRVEGVGGFEKLVALKRLHPHRAEHKEFVDIFLDEARIASRVEHLSVCTVFDFGSAGGEYFIALEHLLGETLQRLWRRVLKDPTLSRAPRWYALALRIVAEASEGLHAAHELRGTRAVAQGRPP